AVEANPEGTHAAHGAVQNPGAARRMLESSASLYANSGAARRTTGRGARGADARAADAEAVQVESDEVGSDLNTHGIHVGDDDVPGQSIASGLRDGNREAGSITGRDIAGQCTALINGDYAIRRRASEDTALVGGRSRMGNEDTV